VQLKVPQQYFSIPPTPGFFNSIAPLLSLPQAIDVAFGGRDPVLNRNDSLACQHACLYDTIIRQRRKEMPEVYIHAIEGRTKEQKRALIKDITDAVVKNFDVTPDAVLVEIIETSRDNKAKGGVLFSER
jgi:4-oxalocrotonate tautomerase